MAMWVRHRPCLLAGLHVLAGCAAWGYACNGYVPRCMWLWNGRLRPAGSQHHMQPFLLSDWMFLKSRVPCCVRAIYCGHLTGMGIARQNSQCLYILLCSATLQTCPRLLCTSAGTQADIAANSASEYKSDGQHQQAGSAAVLPADQAHKALQHTASTPSSLHPNLPSVPLVAVGQEPALSTQILGDTIGRSEHLHAAAAPDQAAAGQSPDSEQPAGTGLEQNPQVAQRPLNSATFDEESIACLNDILAQYVGTHNFHNFTARMAAQDPAAKRYIKKFCCRGTMRLEVGVPDLSRPKCMQLITSITPGVDGSLSVNLHKALMGSSSDGAGGSSSSRAQLTLGFYSTIELCLSAAQRRATTML